MDISICDFATLQKGLYIFLFLDGGPGFFSAAIYASTERFSLVWRSFCSSVSLVQLLNVIQLFMYMSLFFKQYFVNVDTVNRVFVLKPDPTEILYGPADTSLL